MLSPSLHESRGRIAKGWDRTEKSILVISLMAMCAYLITRAFRVPFAHDEAASFFFFIQTGEFIPGLHYFDANNHILHSFLAWISYSLFGASKLALRLPNLLAFPFYAWFIVRIAGLLGNRWLRALFILASLTATGLTEFFALSRGYGISMALFVASIWYLVLYAGSQDTRQLARTLATGTLACAANLTLVVPVIGMLAFIAYRLTWHVKGWKQRVFPIVLWVILGLMPMAAFAYLLMRMRSAGMLYYGSASNPLGQSIPSFTEFMFGSESGFAVYGFLLFLAMVIILIILAFTGREWRKGPAFLVYSWLAIVSLAAVIFLAAVLNVNYPEDRTGLYFLPLLTGSFIFALDALAERWRTISVFASVLIVLPVHFFSHLNTDRSHLWARITPPERFADYLLERQAEGSVPPTISGHRLNLLCWDFDNAIRGGRLNQVQVSDFPSQVADYVIAYKRDFGPEGEAAYSLVLKDPVSGLGLWKRERAFSPDTIVDAEIPAFSGNPDTLNLVEVPAGTDISGPLAVIFDFELTSNEKPFRGWFVADCTGLSGHQECHELIALDWKKPRWTGERSIYSMYLPIQRSVQGHARIYLLNCLRQNYLFKGRIIIVRLLTLEKDSTLQSDSD